MHESSGAISERYYYLDLYKDRKKDYAEQKIKELSVSDINIFDNNWLEIELLCTLQDNNISLDWIEKQPLSKVIQKWLYINDKCIIEASKEWFYGKLKDIESKIKTDKKTGEDIPEGIKIKLRKDLEKKYFGVNLNDYKKEFDRKLKRQRLARQNKSKAQ